MSTASVVLGCTLGSATNCAKEVSRELSLGSVGIKPEATTGRGSACAVTVLNSGSSIPALLLLTIYDILSTSYDIITAYYYYYDYDYDDDDDDDYYYYDDDYDCDCDGDCDCDYCGLSTHWLPPDLTLPFCPAPPTCMTSALPVTIGSCALIVQKRHSPSAADLNNFSCRLAWLTS